MSVQARGEPIAPIPVVGFSRDAEELDLLADSLRRCAQLAFVGGADSLTRLDELAQRAGRAVVVARLRRVAEELPELISHCDGAPAVLIVPDAPRVALQALRSGASGVLGPESSDTQLAAAVTSAFHGLATLPATPSVDLPLALLTPPAALTPREMQVLSLLAAGDSNKTIADRLSISVHTVKFHISSILAKLQVSSRTEAVALGLRMGLVLL